MDRRGAVALDGVECSGCTLGRASGAHSGQFCPFIVRNYARGELLTTSGDPADYLWMVKEGVVGLTRSKDDLDQLEALRLPGDYVGLECLVRDSYLCSARALTRVTLCGATRDGFQRWLRQEDGRLRVILEAALRDPLLVELMAASPASDPPKMTPA